MRRLPFTVYDGKQTDNDKRKSDSDTIYSFTGDVTSTTN